MLIIFLSPMNLWAIVPIIYIYWILTLHIFIIYIHMDIKQFSQSLLANKLTHKHKKNSIKLLFLFRDIIRWINQFCWDVWNYKKYYLLDFCLLLIYIYIFAVFCFFCGTTITISTIFIDFDKLFQDILCCFLIFLDISYESESTSNHNGL